MSEIGNENEHTFLRWKIVDIAIKLTQYALSKHNIERTAVGGSICVGKLFYYLSILFLAVFAKGNYVSKYWKTQVLTIDLIKNKQPSISYQNKQTFRQTNKRTKTNERTNKSSDKQTNERANRQTNEETDKQTNKRTSKQTNWPPNWLTKKRASETCKTSCVLHATQVCMFLKIVILALAKTKGIIFLLLYLLSV